MGTGLRPPPFKGSQTRSKPLFTDLAYRSRDDLDLYNDFCEEVRSLFGVRRSRRELEGSWRAVSDAERAGTQDHRKVRSHREDSWDDAAARSHCFTGAPEHPRKAEACGTVGQVVRMQMNMERDDLARLLEPSEVENIKRAQNPIGMAINRIRTIERESGRPKEMKQRKGQGKGSRQEEKSAAEAVRRSRSRSARSKAS
ncbi:unnamed protein product [Durusdinium trenchii]|uniref:Uncharacterized protein n=1 Tax=Durusdinium trenchii TaxID=1381693 RepID=A0ABP0SYA2_9DINO